MSQKKNCLLEQYEHFARANELLRHYWHAHWLPAAAAKTARVVAALRLQRDAIDQFRKAFVVERCICFFCCCSFLKSHDSHRSHPHILLNACCMLHSSIKSEVASNSRAARRSGANAIGDWRAHRHGSRRARAHHSIATRSCQVKNIYIYIYYCW